MPYHVDKPTKGAMERQKAKSVEKRMTKPKPKKKVKVFETKPANSHLMPDGTIMSGKTHSKDSKVLGKMKKKGNQPAKKGSEEMKKRMAKLRAMRKKK